MESPWGVRALIWGSLCLQIIRVNNGQDQKYDEAKLSQTHTDAMEAIKAFGLVQPGSEE